MASRVLSPCLSVHANVVNYKNLARPLTKRQLIVLLRKRIHTCKSVYQDRKTLLGTSQEFYSLINLYRKSFQRETTLGNTLSLGIMGKSQSKSYDVAGDETVVRTKRYSRNQDSNGVNNRQSFVRISSSEKSIPPSSSVVTPKTSNFPEQTSAQKSVVSSETAKTTDKDLAKQSDQTLLTNKIPESAVSQDATQVSATSQDTTPVLLTSQDATPVSVTSQDATTVSVTSQDATPVSVTPQDATPESTLTQDTTPETALSQETFQESTENLYSPQESAVLQETSKESAIDPDNIPQSFADSDKSESIERLAVEEIVTDPTPVEDPPIVPESEAVVQSSGSDSVFTSETTLEQTETSAAPTDSVLEASTDTLTDTVEDTTPSELLTDTVTDTPVETISDIPVIPPEDSPPEDSPPDNKMSVVEQVVCECDDMKDGEMRECDVGDGKVLLVRSGDNFHAVSAKCTHYGAPLVKGVYCNGRIRCPWHGACFSVETGDIEDFPGLDSLQKFDVEVSDGKVKIKADKSALANHRRQRTMCKCSPDNNKTVLIIGGGPASVSCAETLRQESYTGKISIATREAYLPYDRIQLSKNMGTTATAIALRAEDFYKNNDIDVLIGREATSVDTEGKNVTFQDGSTLPFDTLVLATGGQPRKIPIPGVDLENVCLLRTPDDANTIAEKAQGKNVVIIGSSFIGMEVAVFLETIATSVTVLCRGKVPFENSLGSKIGAIIQKMHEERGVKFYFERGIQSFSGEDGKVTKAVLSDGTELEADLCVLGIGVVPATKFLESSGLTMNKGGFLTVNKHMETDKPGVYAAGDIVNFPLFTCADQEVNVQHWQMAHAHGRNVALNIIGKKTELKSVPYFWTVMYKKSVRYTGYGPGYDDVIFHGDDSKFVAFYTKGEDVVAVASLNFDPIVSQAAEFMCNGNRISKSEIMETPDAWTSRL